MSVNIPRSGKKRVVIVGGGFGGLEVAQKLLGKGLEVVLLDRNNYHQFLPMIYQVASAGVEPSSIVFPFRKLFHGKKDFYFRLGEARTLYPEQKILQTSIGKIEYDYLVLAAGTTTNFFGNQEIAHSAIAMKNVSEAMGLRNAILANLERALTTADETEKLELLNIVIVGGGATGVEIAGALAEMRTHVFPKDYPDVDTSILRIHLLEASDRLLQAMSPESSKHTERYLRSLGVEVQLGAKVEGYRDHKVYLEGGEVLPSRTFIWVSGVTAEPIRNIDGERLGRGSRIVVNEFNQVEGLDGVFAIGDQAIMPQGDPEWQGGHPQLAQPAIQQGKLLARNILRLERGEAMKPFRYRNLGTMATIGRNKAVAEFAGRTMHGYFAWLMWCLVHLRSILGVRNKFIVLLNWIWNYISYSQSLRMIVYATKAREVIEREERLAGAHWGDDLQSAKENSSQGAAQSSEGVQPKG